MQISAIVPAFNEEARIGDTIRALCAIPEIHEVIVVDDGSVDRTAQTAWEAGAHQVISLALNRGKGGALICGVNAACGEVLCFVDADLGASAAEFAALIEPVKSGETDMVVATFPPAQRPAGIGLVKGLAVWGIERLSGFRPQAPLSGQRVLKRTIWEQAVCARDGFGVEVGLTVDCLYHGYTIREVPVSMAHRETGRDLQGFKHRGRQFVDVARTLGRLWLKRRVKI